MYLVPELVTLNFIKRKVSYILVRIKLKFNPAWRESYINYDHLRIILLSLVCKCEYVYLVLGWKFFLWGESDFTATVCNQIQR
jgi:hypothetical protein